VHPTPIIQELQTRSVLSNKISVTIKLIKLSTWWLPQTSDTHIRESRRFESMYALQGKTQPTWHVRFPRQSMYAQRTLPAGGWQSWTESLLLRKRAPDTIHNSPINRSVGPYPVSPPSQLMKQWRKPNICRQQATRLTGPISPTCDRYVQYLLTEANPSVLNRHRRGLQPWRCQLSTHHSPTFPTDGHPLSTKGPRSIFNLTKIYQISQSRV
jgi:hypothetical protein